MATGSGTGTPASGSGTATLATLRARIRTQMQGASGLIEPLAVTASSATLTTLRDRVEVTLQDASNERWSADDLDEAIRKAVEQYSRRNPHQLIATINLSSDSREIDISGISGLLRVEKVWWDYDSATPGYPPNWRQFEVWPGGILYIDDPVQPTAGDVARLWYNKKQTLDGLDGAGATSIADEDITYIVTGAGHFAAQARAIELAETLTVDKDVVKRLSDWAHEQGKNFRYGSGQRLPAWQRRAYAYDQDDIDEAIRWALGRYSEIAPDHAIAAITLAANGREVDISSITDLLQVERIWCYYDAGDPIHSPSWRNFELWPGNILYVKDSDEPQTGDVVRIWYTRPQAINGLDGASTTTLPTDHETLIVTGAVGYVAQERIQEEKSRYVPRKLREWGEARLKEFERGIKQLSRRLGSRASGIAPGPSLDRWDEDPEGWC